MSASVKLAGVEYSVYSMSASSVALVVLEFSSMFVVRVALSGSELPNVLLSLLGPQRPGKSQHAALSTQLATLLESKQSTEEKEAPCAAGRGVFQGRPHRQ